MTIQSTKLLPSLSQLRMRFMTLGGSVHNMFQCCASWIQHRCIAAQWTNGAPLKYASCFKPDSMLAANPQHWLQWMAPLSNMHALHDTWWKRAQHVSILCILDSTQMNCSAMKTAPHSNMLAASSRIACWLRIHAVFVLTPVANHMKITFVRFRFR